MTLPSMNPLGQVQYQHSLFNEKQSYHIKSHSSNAALAVGAIILSTGVMDDLSKQHKTLLVGNQVTSHVFNFLSNSQTSTYSKPLNFVNI